MSLPATDQFNLPCRSERGASASLRLCISKPPSWASGMPWQPAMTQTPTSTQTFLKERTFYRKCFQFLSHQLLLSTFNRVPVWTQALGQCLVQSAAGCPGKWRKMTEPCGKTRAVTHPLTPPGFFPAEADLGNIHLGKMKNSCSCPASTQDNTMKALCILEQPYSS